MPPRGTVMIRFSFLIAILAAVSVGCDASGSPSATTSSVPATEVTKPMVGRWGVDGEAVLIIFLEGDRIIISAPANDTWRMDIHDANIVDNSIHFVQKYYLHSGEFHPFNGVACNSIAKIVDEDKLELGLTTVQTPEFESSILTRLK